MGIQYRNNVEGNMAIVCLHCGDVITDEEIKKIRAKTQERMVELAIRDHPETKPSDYIFRRCPPFMEVAIIRQINQTLKRSEAARRKK